jgi:hypothetical protein
MLAGIGPGGDGSSTGGASEAGSEQGGSAGTAAGGSAASGNAGQAGSSVGGTGGGAGGGAGACSSAVALTPTALPAAAPPVTCAYPGALVCEDFESGQKPYWTVLANPPAQLALEGCLFHGGANALSAYSANSANQAQLQAQLSPTVGSGSLFVRSFVYLPSSSVLPDWTVLDEVWDSPTKWTNKISIDLQPDGSVTINNWAGSGQTKTSLTSSLAVIPRDQWLCMELEIVVDKLNGATRLYFDDTQVITSTGGIRTRGTKNFCTASMGAASGASAIELYQDDFVVATQRIGCN